MACPIPPEPRRPRKLLAQVGLRLADIDPIELNEAFAAQALAAVNGLEQGGGRWR